VHGRAVSATAALHRPVSRGTPARNINSASHYAEIRPLLEFIVAGGLAITVKAGLELLGVGVADPRLPLLPLDDEGRVALNKLLTDA